MNTKLLFLAIICLALSLKCVISPLLFYTPYSSFMHKVQTTPTQQTAAVVAPVSSLMTMSFPSAVSTTSSSDIPITISATAQIGQNITSGGNYVIPNFISYSGTLDATCAILVSRSNTIIDLNGQTVAFSGTVSANSISAIKIAAGVTNVTIRNGTISNFPGAAIDATEESSSPRNHLTIDSVKIVSCYHAILITNTHNLTLSNCITSGNNNPNGTTCGIKIERSSSITVQGCISQNHTSPLGNCYGFMF